MQYDMHEKYIIQTNFIISQLAMFYSLQCFKHHQRPSSEPHSSWWLWVEWVEHC